MCTLILLRRGTHRWPLLAAANRDEMNNRPWLPPARHWPDRPEIVAGLDCLAGGTWMGLNDHGVMAAVLNRRGTLGPAAGKRSRGELCLEALDHADAVDAADALSALNPDAYRPFNMMVADNRDAYFIRSDGRQLKVTPLEEDGLYMLTAFEVNDPHDPRIAHFLPRWRLAAAPDPDRDDWASWTTLMSEAAPPEARHPETGMCFDRPDGFGTRSGMLLALPGPDRPAEQRIVRFCAAPPGQAPFLPLDGEDQSA